jgi:hypothetical protein
VAPRIGDFVDWANPEEIRQLLREKADRYLDFLNDITAGAPRTERNLAIFHLARAAGTHVERLHLWLDQGADALAWCARNLFELDLILRFVLASDENVLDWIGQRTSDEIQFIDAMVEWSSEETAAVSELKKRREELVRIAREHGIELKPFRSTSDLARFAGLKEEYEGIFKLLSKHVHPSSFLVNEDAKRVHGWNSINVFLTLAQLYAADIEERVRRALDL